MCRSYFGNDLVFGKCTNTRAASAKREPRLHDRTQRCDVLLNRTLLKIRMEFVLNDGWFYFGNFHQAVNIGFIEIRDAYRTDFSSLNASFHSLISMLVITRSMVQQQQVDIIESESFKTFVNLFVCTIKVRRPEFRRYEYFGPVANIRGLNL